MEVTTTANDTAWPDFMPPREDWAEPYWQALASGRLLLSHCAVCNRSKYPPVKACCADCGEPTGWLETSGLATLWSWATFHREYYQNYPLTPPYTVLMVELPEGVRMLASLATETSPAELLCDMNLTFSPVEVAPGVWIPGFRPET